MTTKHTPGCRFTPAPSWSILESEDGRRLTIDCDGGPMLPRKVIATVYNSRRVDGKANARLIAAAPDLLAVCETAAAMLGNMTSMEYSAGLDRTVRDMLARALSRAKGGAS